MTDESMTTLNIASKANQATTLPALIIARYAQESDPNASIKTNFEETEALKASGKEVIELAVGSRTSNYGTEHVIRGLVDTYPFLQGKHGNAVSEGKYCKTTGKIDVSVGRRMVGQNFVFLSYRL